jgi:hypothetical protein
LRKSAISGAIQNEEDGDEKKHEPLNHHSYRKSNIGSRIDQAQAKKQRRKCKPAHVLYLSLTEAVRATWSDCGNLSRFPAMTAKLRIGFQKRPPKKNISCVMNRARRRPRIAPQK